MNKICVSAHITGHEVTRCLSKRSRGLEWSTHTDSNYDYRCGKTYVLIHDYLSVEPSSGRAAVCQRLQAVQGRADGNVVLLIWMNALEPSAECLSWINLDCGLAYRCSVVFCWATEEVAQFLETLAAASPAAFHSSGAFRNESSPLPLLIQALTQAPQILPRNDVIRVANRSLSVADVLSSAADRYQSIPGFGAKKTGRLHALLNAPFYAQSLSIGTVLPKEDTSHRLANSDHTSSLHPAVEEALLRLRNREDEDEIA